MINSILRSLIASYFGFLARMIAWDNRIQRRRYRKRYAFFYGRNGIGNFPVAGFGEQRDRLQQVYDKMPSPKFFAETSGTTSAPKQIPFDVKRTRFMRKTFLRSMITLTRDLEGHKTFFVFASLKKDNSLTAGLTDEDTRPSRLELLQAPYRFLQTKEGEALIARVGELTARIMVLAITQPKILYATNPSTLTFFLRELELRWKEVRVRLKNIPPGLMKLSDKNGERLLMTFLIRDKAPKLQELLPDLKIVITWDGGYVKPFLDQLKAKLPGVVFLPMYSMSTETIETLPHRIGEKLYFFPLSRGTYPEFEDLDNGRHLAPFDVEAGKAYELIMSDEWGLRRYATGDLFFVKEMVGHLPDMAFLRRRGVNSSVTGEKITEAQVNELALALIQRFPVLERIPMTLFPVSRDGEIGYEFAVIGNVILPDEFDQMVETELGKINHEYAAKVKSGRLKHLTTACYSEEALARLMGKEDHWESQFKILPLYEKLIVR